MAWLIVLATEGEPSKDARVEVQRFKRGDVLDVFPDGWVPARLEKNNPLFKIIKVPGAPKLYEDLMASDLAFSSDAVTYPQRKKRLDLDDLQAATEVAKKTDPTAGAILEVSLADAARLRAKLKASEAARSDLVIE